MVRERERVKEGGEGEKKNYAVKDRHAKLYKYQKELNWEQNSSAKRERERERDRERKEREREIE